MRVVFEDGLMMLMDEENKGHDCMTLGRDKVKQCHEMIDYWANYYKLNRTKYHKRRAEVACKNVA